MMGSITIQNGNILTPTGILTDSAMVLHNGKIAAFVHEPPESSLVLDAGGGWILPGFVDIHLHGGGGFDFMDGTPEAFNGIGKMHAAHGTTSLLPTTVSCPLEQLYRLFSVFRLSQTMCRHVNLLGIHLEGPFLAEPMKGAHNSRYLSAPKAAEIDRLLDTAGDIILRCSCAPELPGVYDMADKMARYGISMSIAHSNATCGQALDAIGHGFRHITHLYCSTPSVRKIGQRVYAGVVEACFLDDRFTAELIGDGRHVPKDVLKMVYKIKGADKTALITDAIRAAGTSATQSYLGENRPENSVIIEDEVAKLPNRSSFAGSIATADRVFRKAVESGIPVLDVSKMMSLTPSVMVGVADRKGSIVPGKDADIIIMDSMFRVQHVLVNGNISFSEESRLPETRKDISAG